MTATTASLECKKRILYSTLALITLLLVLFNHHSLIRMVSAQQQPQQQQQEQQPTSASTTTTHNQHQSSFTPTPSPPQQQQQQQLPPIMIDRGEDDSKYHVLIRDNMDMSTRDDYDPSRIIPMTINDQLFTCFIPSPAATAASMGINTMSSQDDNNSNNNNNSQHHQQQDNKTHHLLNQMIMDLNKKCMYRMGGWWIYELCINRHMRQYHQEMSNGEITMDYILGNSTETEKPMQSYTVHMSSSDPEDSYLSLQYKDGTKCDLNNGEPRTTEVRLYCASDKKRQQFLLGGGTGFSKMTYFLGDIEEPVSCSYLAKVYLNTLCDIPGFAKKEDNISKIQCVPYSVAQSFITQNKVVM